MRPSHLALAAAALAALADSAGAQAARLNIIALDVHAPIAPTPVAADGRTHLVYELRVTNVGTKPRALAELRITGDAGGAPLAVIAGDELKAIASVVGARTPDADGRVVAAGQQSLLYVWVTLPAGARVPTRLHHRFLVTPADSLASPTRDTLDGPDVAVSTRIAPTLGAPFAGGPWLASNGPSNVSFHRRTVIPKDGLARIPQRFATDWLELGPDGRLWHGDSTVNANWYGYGAPIIAVADAKVVEVLDGVPENVALSPERAIPITLESAAGNHILLDLGGGAFAMYAHLKPGSIRVKRGDRVTRGQRLALLGNSGNSDAPHLHFHVTDRASPLGTEGLPFVFDRFEQLDRMSLPADMDIPPAWTQPAGKSQTRIKETVLGNSVVRFR